MKGSLTKFFTSQDQIRADLVIIFYLPFNNWIYISFFTELEAETVTLGILGR